MDPQSVGPVFRPLQRAAASPPPLYSLQSCPRFPPQNTGKPWKIGGTTNNASIRRFLKPPRLPRAQTPLLAYNVFFAKDCGKDLLRNLTLDFCRIDLVAILPRRNLCLAFPHRLHLYPLCLKRWTQWTGRWVGKMATEATSCDQERKSLCG